MDDRVRGRVGEGIDVSEPLDLLADPGDEVGVDVVEVQGGLEQA